MDSQRFALLRKQRRDGGGSHDPVQRHRALLRELRVPSPRIVAREWCIQRAGRFHLGRYGERMERNRVR